MDLPKQLNTVTRLSKLIALILFITLPFLGFYIGSRYGSLTEYSSNYENLSQSQEREGGAMGKDEAAIDKIPNYRLEEKGYFLEEDGYHRYYGDASLIYLGNQSGKEEILVESIASELPSDALRGRKFVELTASQDGVRLYFVSFLVESDDPIHDIYEFNTESKSFSLLTNVSGAYSGWGAKIISPDGTRIARVNEESDSRNLRLLDLRDGSVNVIVSLPEGRSLNECGGRCLGLGAVVKTHIEWFDDSTIIYAVYDTSDTYMLYEDLEYQSLSSFRKSKLYDVYKGLPGISTVYRQLVSIEEVVVQ